MPISSSISASHSMRVAAFGSLLFVGLASPAIPQTGDAPLRTAIDQEEGQYLVAGNGYSLYLFKADTQGRGDRLPKSVCEGDCLATWPPLLVDALPVGTGEVRQDLLGTMTLPDGSLQVTYNGWPLYFYAEDIQPGEINGHDIQSFGEDWYLVGPNGERARD
jgi:predicted lipoprotein with Yx(FWY)xxD motif